MEILSLIWFVVSDYLAHTWWLILFVFLFTISEQTWLFYRQEKMKSEIVFILLELRIPREILRTPFAMEQTLTSIHQLGNYPGDFREYYIDGEVTNWYSLEMVSFGGETHFYIRTYKKQKGLIEAAVVAYYPDIEVVEVDDYTERFPKDIQSMQARGYKCWGAELLLARDDAYPIRTYQDFESQDENKQFDPMSAFIEVLAKLKKEEIVAIQLNIWPIPFSQWKSQKEHFVEGLKAEFQKLKVEKSVGAGGVEIEKLAKAFSSRTPGETDILKAVEENLSLPAFYTLIRFIYLSPKHLYYDSFARRALTGAFNQYAGLDLNYFERNNTMSTRVMRFQWPHIFIKTRGKYREQRLLYNYRARKRPMKTFMAQLITSYLFNWNFASHSIFLTTRSLATLFHPPTYGTLTAPHIERMESRKVGPPAGMAIYGEESDISKFE